jgi:hypothetical protein
MPGTAGADGGPVIVDIEATIWHRSWCCPGGAGLMSVWVKGWRVAAVRIATLMIVL